MRERAFTWIMTAFAVLLSVAVTLAQGQCSEFVDLALEAVDDNCSELGRNQACYGFDQVEAGFQVEVEDDFFTEPADTAEVAMLETIRTAPFDLDGEQWGVAVMVLQANLPDTLPGQNVTFILMGDTEVENAVSPDEAFDPVEGIEVTVSFPQGAAVRSGPGDNFNTIGGVVVGTVFLTDGVSEDGGWLRVIFEDRPGWIRRTVVQDNPDIDSLPTLSSDLHTPMQAFYLRTGIGQPSCNDVPDNSLLVQGPEDIQIDLTVNGANIELGSSGVLRIIEVNGEPMLEIVVLDGEFVVKADEFNPQDIVIRPGFRTTLCLTGGNNEGLNRQADDLVVTCGASTPEQIDINAFNDEWCAFENFPENLLNYALSTCYGTHTIQPGENLFRISQYYCVTIPEITSISGIANPDQIVVGQVLIIPPNACEGFGSTVPPPGAIPPTEPDETEEPEDNTTGVDCSNFTLPQQPVVASNFTLDWQDVPGATNYVVAVFDGESNTEVLTFPTSESFLATNGGNWPSSGYVDVRAYNNDTYACYARMSFSRSGDPNPPPPQQPKVFSASIIFCSYDSFTNETTVTVRYSGAQDTDIVRMDITEDPFYMYYSATARNTGESGDLTAAIMWDSLVYVDVVTSSGDTFSSTCTG